MFPSHNQMSYATGNGSSILYNNTQSSDKTYDNYNYNYCPRSQKDCVCHQQRHPLFPHQHREHRLYDEFYYAPRSILEKSATNYAAQQETQEPKQPEGIYIQIKDPSITEKSCYWAPYDEVKIWEQSWGNKSGLCGGLKAFLKEAYPEIRNLFTDKNVMISNEARNVMITSHWGQNLRPGLKITISFRKNSFYFYQEMKACIYKYQLPKSKNNMQRYRRELEYFNHYLNEREGITNGSLSNAWNKVPFVDQKDLMLLVNKFDGYFDSESFEQIPVIAVTPPPKEVRFQ